MLATIIGYNIYDEYCMEADVWAYLQDNYGWDQDNDGVDVWAYVPGEDTFAEVGRQIVEAENALGKGGTSSKTSKPSTNTSTASKSSKTSTPACEHDYVAEVTTPATCIAEGVTTYTCSKCGDTYTEAIPIDADAHEWGEPITAEPTCTEVGTITKTYNLCGTSAVEEIPALGHDYKEIVTKEPTCTELGVKTFTCSRCGDTYTEDIPALGHVESDWIIDKEASLFFEGSRHKICTRCNEVLTTEAIPSRYPTWYLYALIGIGIVIVGIVIGVCAKKKRDDDNAKELEISPEAIEKLKK